MSGSLLISISAYAYGQVVSPIYSFNSAAVSGSPQYVVLVQDRDASLWGTTFGSAVDFGSVFKLTTNGAERDIYSLDGTQGSEPYGGLLLGADGNFYGTTAFGDTVNDGALFRITRSGVYTVLHDFAGDADGRDPLAPPIQASDGNLYGGTVGNVNSTIYQYSRTGVFSTIYQFDQAHGFGVVGQLIQGADGSLYGTATGGGVHNCGTIFKLSRAGVIFKAYSFPCGQGGSSPNSALLQASDGNFYGTATAGGTGNVGIAFKMTPTGKVSILHNFQDGTSDGSQPVGALTQGTDGNLYGTTFGGGKSGAGTLFQITTAGAYSLLYSFVPTIGEGPQAGLRQHTNGKFYGTTTLGGAFDSGAVYSLDMGLGPFITFVSATGRVGAAVQILGQGLTGATSVTFNGVPASSVKVVTDTFLTAVVPAGATTGPVVVTTPTGTLTSNVSFIVGR
ncbi:MAG: choice-of-anchor tandem repeat GloVer-containing protein [Candidatus Sulfotelmatobacter sp.]